MNLELKGKKRTELGKKVRTLRNKGFIPAELFGKGVKNEHISVEAKEFKLIFDQAGESTMINLSLDSSQHPVLIQDVQRHYLSDDIISIDFYQPRLDELITVHVPLKFIGESSAVKDKDGVLVKSASEIEIETLPTNIPHDIEVDLSQIKEIGESIHVNDLKIPEGIKVLSSAEAALVTVTEKISEEEDQAMATEANLDAIATEADKDKEEVEGEEEEKPKEEEKEEK